MMMENRRFMRRLIGKYFVMSQHQSNWSKVVKINSMVTSHNRKPYKSTCHYRPHECTAQPNINSTIVLVHITRTIDLWRLADGAWEVEL